MSAFAPKISIIIPVYNGTNYMREAIDSALAQTYKNIEVIVINDGSRDNGATLEVAKSYGDKIRLIDKPNGGVATALNAGIAAMRGEYFSWLSHDDVYPADKLEMQVAALSTLADKQTILFGDYTLIDEQGREMGKVAPSAVDTKNMLFELYASQCIHGCSLLVPKAAFEKAGNFRTDLPTTQDYDLWLRMAQHFNFHYAPGITAKSRQHAEQGSRNINHTREVAQFYISNFALFTPEWLAQHYDAAALKAKYAQLLQKFAYERMNGAFWRVWLQAMRHLTFKNLFERVCFGLKAFYYFNKGGLFGLIKKMIPLSIKNILRRNLNRRGGFLKSTEPLTLDFVNIYRKNIFGSNESRSGGGSTLEQTATIRAELPKLFSELGVTSLLDVPCGDMNWMKLIDLSNIRYIGGDIVPEIITKNNVEHAAENRSFEVLNIITDDLPKVDVIFCRDCLVHLKFEDGLKAIRNFKKSGSKYLLTTTFTDRPENEDLYGIWRTLNLQKAPYNLPQPLKIINENCTEGRMKFTDKALGLWDLQALDI